MKKELIRLLKLNNACEEGINAVEVCTYDIEVINAIKKHWEWIITEFTDFPQFYNQYSEILLLHGIAYNESANDCIVFIDEKVKTDTILTNCKITQIGGNVTIIDSFLRIKKGTAIAKGTSRVVEHLGTEVQYLEKSFRIRKAI